MSLNIFFDPVDEKVFEDITDPQALYFYINVNTSYNFPELEDTKVAIVGLTEERDSKFNKGLATGSEEIRRKLYRLNKGKISNNVTDLGDLRAGLTAEDTRQRLSEVCRILLEQDINTIIIGGSHDMMLGQFEAYGSLESRITVLNIDAFVDMDLNDETDKSRSYLQQLYTHLPNYLFNYIHMAYQTYLVDESILSALEKLYFDLIRLGKIKESLKEIEPVIRDAHMMSFDVSAIKMTDAPGNYYAQPFGLSAEEACQICWYAGMSTKMRSVGFYEYNPTFDNREQTAGVLATMIWYFIDGIYHRKSEAELDSDLFVKYYVSLNKHPHSMVFYKSKLTEKWWMEVPFQSQPGQSYLASCSYEDYSCACNGEVPDRWISTFARLI
jgi:formiminoglutamase